MLNRRTSRKRRSTRKSLVRPRSAETAGPTQIRCPLRGVWSDSTFALNPSGIRDARETLRMPKDPRGATWAARLGRGAVRSAPATSARETVRCNAMRGWSNSNRGGRLYRSSRSAESCDLCRDHKPALKRPDHAADMALLGSADALEQVDSLSWRAFEELVQRLFEGAGYECRHVGTWAESVTTGRTSLRSRVQRRWQSR